MAKSEKRVKDLDAELARLEAELAALERGEVPGAPPAKAAEPEPAEAPAEAAPAKKTSLLGRFGKKRASAPEPAAPPAPEPVVSLPIRDAAVPKGLPVPDAAGAWSREGRVWTRKVDLPRTTYRRVLDADGNVVEEARADEGAPSPGDAPAEKPAGSAFLRRFRKG